MASKAEKQTIAIISLIHGAARVLKNENRVCRVDIKEAIERINIAVPAIREKISPDIQDKDLLLILNWVGIEFHTAINKLNIDEKIHTNTLIHVGQMALIDLLEKVKNHQKKAILQRLEGDLWIVANWCDPKGEHFKYLENADLILNAFYKIIQFEK
jgi:hypothetical protein